METAENIGTALLGLLAIISIIALVALLGAAFAWFAVEAVGGHDISFREAVGIGLLLGASSASASRD